jgi:hypothetical protein
MPTKMWHGKETMGVSLSGGWPDSELTYELEGPVMVHFLKRWSDDEERFVSSLLSWHDLESFIVKFSDGDEQLLIAEELPDEVAQEVACLLQKCLD